MPTLIQPSAEVMDTVFGILEVEQFESLFCEPELTDEATSEQPWVLSIDDDDNVALALEIRMERLGVQFIRSATGMEGYRTAFMQAPRAILLDYEMPNGNGDYVLRRLKESPATAQIPVICLTGRHENTIERKMRALGADDFFTKPFNWNELWGSLSRFIKDGC